MTDEGYWFRPRRYGFGSGVPIKWQGWALVLVTLAVIWSVVFWFPDRPLIIISVAVPAAIVCAIIAARTTRGGWRWRWGEKD
ncbi:MAG: hypothetical protein ABIW33_00465 [Sphingomicrobium sp.]